jgi:hypothetical protein
MPWLSHPAGLGAREGEALPRENEMVLSTDVEGVGAATQSYIITAEQRWSRPLREPNVKVSTR